MKIKKLTEQARAYCVAAIGTMERNEIVSTLESLGIACYDDEETSDLVESYVDSVEAEDIDFDWSYAAAMQYPHHVKMLNLDVDEVWQD